MNIYLQVILAIILGSTLLFSGLSLYSRYKLRKKVQQAWGKQPHQVRLDKEASLKQAWQASKKFHQWDSEVDDITWYDLDLMRIFDLINATNSSVGSEALYHRLRNFNFAQDEELEELISFYQENPQIREDVQFYFAGLGKQDNNYTNEYLAKGDHHALPNTWLYIVAGLLPIISVGVIVFLPPIGLALLVASFVGNTMLYMTKKNQLETELESMRYLVQTIYLAKQVVKLKTPLQEDLKKNFRPLRSITNWGFSFRSKTGSESEMVFDYLNMLFMLPFIAYNYVIKRIATHNTEAIELWQLLGKLEVAAAILNFRTYMPLLSIPQFRPGGVAAQDSYHPLIPNPVANPVNWRENTLVTGSNASGKSTYVKSVAINCLLAQTINTTLATSFSLQRGHVITSMAVEDDLFEGDSYFVAEIKSIKRLLDKVATGKRCYCFIDEILKGTNTIERIAASSSVVDWIHQYPSLAFVATHDIELTEMLKNQCANVHFSEQVTPDQGISFDYLLKEGPSTSRNAIALLQVLKYPPAIVENAQKEAAYFTAHRQWQIFPDR